MTFDASTDATPRLVAPPDSCDTHLHFYDPKYPTVPGTSTPPAGATVDAYRKLQARLGLTRAVVVQPSAYARTIAARSKALLHWASIARAALPSSTPASATRNSRH